MASTCLQDCHLPQRGWQPIVLVKVQIATNRCMQLMGPFFPSAKTLSLPALHGADSTVFTAALHRSRHVNMLVPVTQPHSAVPGFVTWGLEARNFIPIFLPLAAFPFFLSHKFDKDFTNFPTLQQKETSLV